MNDISDFPTEKLKEYYQEINKLVKRLQEIDKETLDSGSFNYHYVIQSEIENIIGKRNLE